MTYYDILQVLPTASPEVIKMAYKALAKMYHPDVFEGNKEYAEMKMKQINEAYSILSSPASRQEYDKFILRVKEEYHQPHQPEYVSPPKRKRKRGKLNLGTIIIVVLLMIVAIGPIGLAILSYSDSLDTITTKLNEYMAPRATPLPATAIPRSGAILSGSKVDNGSKLTVSASGGSSCVVKLKTASGVERLSFYVRAGDTVTVGVPAEYMYVYFATGNAWYGRELLFGDRTYYSKDDKLLDFTNYTWEYTLYPVNDGNFSETPIDADEFK